MDGTLRTPFIAINLIMIWLSAKAEIDECGDVIMNASSSVTSIGSDITISCSLNQSTTCRKIDIIKSNQFSQSPFFKDSNSISIHVHNLTAGETAFTCILDCEKSRSLICGIYIEAGNSPDEPKNMSCIQYGEHGTIACTWEAGQDTYINTQYKLQIENGTHRWIASASRNNSHTFDLPPFSINRNPKSSFKVRVNASNHLGNAMSLPFTFIFCDIVKPHPPTHLLITFQNVSANSCTVEWQDHQEMHLFQLRYRPTHDSSWNMAEVINTKNHDIWDLTAFTQYEFQVSGKLCIDKGKWSEWSLPVIRRTPEAAPTGKLNIWYKIYHKVNNTQKITLFWKKMTLSEAKGKILHYEVTFQKQVEKTFQKHTSTTTQSWFDEVIDKAVTTITVSACNARGKSPPTYISISHHSGLPYPQNVIANSSNDGRIFVSWKPPMTTDGPVDEYVVEWSDSQSREYPSINWMKVPSYIFSATLSDHLKPNICYYINVYALSENKAGMAAHARGYSKQMVPLKGPEISLQMGVENSAIVSWKEIPLNMQMGCIISYSLYLRQQNLNATTASLVHLNESDPNEFRIQNLIPSVTYSVWMTASTEKGESPKGNEELIYINIKNASEDSVSIIVAATLIGTCCVCICLMFAGCQRFTSRLATFLPLWCSRPVPDPANSAWAKEYKSVKDNLRLLSNQLSSGSSSCEEPETIEVQEMLSEEESMDSIDPATGTWNSPPMQMEARTLQEGQLSGITQELELAGTRAGENALNYKCQVLCWYKAVVPEEPSPMPPFSHCLPEPMVDMTVTYLPTNVLPPNISCLEDSADTHCDPFTLSTFSKPFYSVGGKLTLDAVKIDCSSFAQ